MARYHAIESLLHQFAQIATYDSLRRYVVIEKWPTLMSHLLDTLEAGEAFRLEEDRWVDDRGRGSAIAAMLLTPHARVTDSNIAETHQRAGADWIRMEDLEPLIARWVPFAQGSASCVDSLVEFLRTQDRTIQSSEGLDLVIRVVDDRFDEIPSHTFVLCEWLQEVWEAGLPTPEQTTKFHVLVDGLTSSGDSRALRLQQAIERP
jgi:hypothetical protein